MSIEPGTFDDFINLEVLWLHRNNLIKLYPGLFNSLSNLSLLYLSHQNIKEIKAGNVFNNLHKLQRLYLHNNSVTHLDANVFSGLTLLKVLYLSNNRLAEFAPDMFVDLVNVFYFAVEFNLLRRLPASTFNRFQSLQIAKLQNNTLRELGNDVFENCKVLESVDLRGNDLKFVEKNAFRGVPKDTKILVDDYGTCCFVNSAECFATNPRPVYLTCQRLLSNQGLRIAMWILGFGALFGNIHILNHWVSQWRKNSLKYVQFLLMFNLSLSDLLMGIYLLILTSVDTYYADYFPSFAESWRQSLLCKFAGTLSVLSSQASVFFITLISLDRFVSIKYPFSQFRMGKKSTKLILSFLWLSAFVIAVVPLCIPNISSDVYDVSEVCIGLPMSRKLILGSETHSIQSTHYDTGRVNVKVADIIGSKPGMYYSIAIFICLNLTCFIIVALCYLGIFLAIRASRQDSGRSQRMETDMRMAINVSAVVLTDFMCWVPIILVCILVQCGLIVISPVMYAWTVAFILPINSAANPFVYGGVTKILDAIWVKFQSKKQISSSNSMQSVMTVS